MSLIIDRHASFSSCRRYRYSLWRQWHGLLPCSTGYALFIGLNPSTADDQNDDPTIRRCIAFAHAWGYNAMCMANLFAFRATDPTVMKNYPLPVGPDNNEWITQLAKDAGIVIAAWGVHGSFLRRDEEILKLLPEAYCLGTTKEGYPRHPLYVAKTMMPQKYFRGL